MLDIQLDILHLVWHLCTKNSASNCVMFRWLQTNVLKYLIKHALKSYKINWCIHRIKKKGIYIASYIFALIIKENSEWNTSDVKNSKYRSIFFFKKPYVSKYSPFLNLHSVYNIFTFSYKDVYIDFVKVKINLDIILSEITFD